jgi:hypothetical protein
MRTNGRTDMTKLMIAFRHVEDDIKRIDVLLTG